MDDGRRVRNAWDKLWEHPEGPGNIQATLKDMKVSHMSLK